MKKLIVIGILSVMFSCGKSNSFKKGDKIYVTSATFASINNDDVYDEMCKIGRRRDKAAMSRMMESGKVTTFDTFQELTYLGWGFDKYYVEYNGEKYIVPQKAFEKKRHRH